MLHGQYRSWVMLPGLSEKGVGFFFFASECHAWGRTEFGCPVCLYSSPGWCSSIFVLDH